MSGHVTHARSLANEPRLWRIDAELLVQHAEPMINMETRSLGVVRVIAQVLVGGNEVASLKRIRMGAVAVTNPQQSGCVSTRTRDDFRRFQMLTAEHQTVPVLRHDAKEPDRTCPPICWIHIALFPTPLTEFMARAYGS